MMRVMAIDIDPMEAVEQDDEDEAASPSSKSKKEESKSRLNSAVAIAVALLATFMGICSVKDDNIVQAMQQAQADKIDHWAFYQARNIREEVMAATAVQLETARAAAKTDAERAVYDAPIATYRGLAMAQGDKKESIKDDAGKDQAAYDSLNYRDDQFDLCDALIAISISLFAVTSLTQKRWLYAVALVPTFFGVLMGLAGLIGWHIHSDLIARWLS
jgi:hypothetical protein